MSRTSHVGRLMLEPLRVAVVIPRSFPIFGGAENQCALLNEARRRARHRYN